MTWLIAVAAGLFAAILQYGRGITRPDRLPLVVLRGTVVSLVIALLLNAPAGRAHQQVADVALDASESWLRATDSAAWKAASDSAARLGKAAGVRLFQFGDSVRAGGARVLPRDHASALRGIVDEATGSGRPVVVVTDGELDEPELLASLPRGSRVVVVARNEGSDAAVLSLEAPRALLIGDTMAVKVTVGSGAAGSAAGMVGLRLDDTVLDSVAVGAMEPFGERALTLRGVVRGDERPAVLRAIVRTTGDREARNDTLSIGVDATKAPAAVFISTAPDYDSREAVAALRSVTSLPTRAYLRVAPGTWRSDAGLTRVDEPTVRVAAHDAPMVVLHGDTSIFGAPRTATRGSLLLFAPPSDEGEWFPYAAPASPIAPALGAFPFDSLAPIAVAPIMPVGEWQGLLVRRGGSTEDHRPALVGWEAPRRIAVLGASGFWRWRFRGGVKADAYATFFGSLFDWLSAGRVDRRSVLPDASVLRTGLPVRWRPGSSDDSVVTAIITSRVKGAYRDSLTLRFADAAVAETAPLPPGVYDIAGKGGPSVLVVNQSREWLPRRPVVKSGAVGGAASLGDAPMLRDWGWIYGLIVLALCAEWLLRRRVGLR